MSYPKLVVWYVSDSPEVLQHSVEVMAGYDWVDRVLVLSTIGKPLLDKVPDKVVQKWTKFGEGRHRPVEMGGFDQVTARNVALQLSETFNPDWLLQCDSDEIYLDQTKELLSRKEDLLWVACYPMFNLTQYISSPLHPRLKLLDPHPRLFRPGFRFVPNGDKEFARTLPNKTNHCMLNLSKKHREGVTKHGVLYHLHLKHIMRGKPHTSKKLVEVGRVMPEGLNSWLQGVLEKRR